MGGKLYGPKFCRLTKSVECKRARAVKEASSQLSGVAKLAVAVYERAGRQWLVGSGGAYGLNFPAVAERARLAGIELDEEVMARVSVLELEQLAEWERAEDAREQERKRQAAIDKEAGRR